MATEMKAYKGCENLPWEGERQQDNIVTLTGLHEHVDAGYISLYAFLMNIFRGKEAFADWSPQVSLPGSPSLQFYYLKEEGN